MLQVHLPSSKKLLKSGFLALTAPSQNKKELKKMLSPFYIDQIMERALALSWRLDKPRTYKKAQKALKLVKLVSCLIPYFSKMGNYSTNFIGVLLPHLDKLMTKNRHGVYLTLKILSNLSKDYPDVLISHLKVDFLEKLGRRIMVLKKAQHHKRKLRLAIKLLNILPKRKKAALARNIVYMERDFKEVEYKNEISEIVFSSPISFASQMPDFLLNTSLENWNLKYLGRLLNIWTKDVAVAKAEYANGLMSFFDEVLVTKALDWSVTRFILVYIVNFEFAWEGMRFKSDFIYRLLKYVYQNPKHLDFIKEKINVIDRFLLNNEVLNHPVYVKNLRKMTDSGFVKQVLKKRLVVQQSYSLYDKRNLEFIKTLKSILRASYRTLYPMPAIFFNEPKFNYLKLKGLIELSKTQESPFFCYVSSQKNCRDIAIIGTHRSKKVLRVVKLGNQNLQFAKEVKTSIKKFYIEEKSKKNSTRKIKKKIIGITLKKHGFNQNTQEGDYRIAKPGNSFLYIYELSKENGLKRDNIPTTLKFHSKKSQKKLDSVNLIYIQKFDEEIKGFEMIKNKIHFWGSSVYGVVSIEASYPIRSYGPHISRRRKGVKILEAKLQFFKRFSHCLIKRLLPFNEQNFMIEPQSKKRLLELYNIDGGMHTLIQIGDKEKRGIQNINSLLC